MTDSPAIARALAAWGRTPPDWIIALAGAADRTSQRAVARLIGYSPAVINQVLGRSYRGSLARVEHAVRLALLPERIHCPVIGPITSTECVVYQTHPAWTNHVRAELARTCPTCPKRETI